MANFKIGEDAFQSRRLNAFDQLKIYKRLISPLANIVSVDVLKSFRQEGESAGESSQFFGLFAKAAQAIPDEDLEFIINKCCSVVERHYAGAWAPILIPPNNVFAFPDLQSDPGKLLRISFEVIRENLAGFFDALPSTLGLGEISPSGQA